MSVEARRVRDGWVHQMTVNGVEATVPCGGDRTRLVVRQVWAVRYWRDGRTYVTAADSEEQARRDLAEVRHGRGLVAELVRRWIVVSATEWEGRA